MHKTPTVPAPSLSPAPADHPADTVRVKTEGKKRRRAVDPVDREAKARERTLRNRAAAQLSREKKRRYLEELQSDNLQLRLDNASLTSRLSSIEADNRGLTRKLEAVTLQLSAMQNQMSFLASLASCRNDAAVKKPLGQPSSPASIGTPMLCSDAGSDIELDGKADEAPRGDEKLSVDFGESAALSKLAPEIDSQLFMSILADALGPSYSSGVSPSLQEGSDSTSTAAPFPEADRKQPPPAHQRKGVQAARPEKKQPAAAGRRNEAFASDIPMDGSLDLLSGLVDFELFEQSMQSSDDDDNTSRNSRASADFDAHALLSNYGSLLDAKATPTPTSSAFLPIF